MRTMALLSKMYLQHKEESCWKLIQTGNDLFGRAQSYEKLFVFDFERDLIVDGSFQAYLVCSWDLGLQHCPCIVVLGLQHWTLYPCSVRREHWGEGTLVEE